MNCLLLYIGNGMVKCALTTFSPGEIPKIQFIEKLEVGHFETIDKNNMRLAVARTLEKLCQNSQARLHDPKIKVKKINKIVTILAAPWYISETKILKARKEEEFLIKENTIAEFIESAEGDMAKKYSEALIALEQKIIQISLNGYATGNPIRKKAKEMEVSLVESFADKEMVENAKNIISKYFTTSAIEFHSLSLSSFAAMRDLFKDQENFLIINITTILTEVSLVKNGILHETVSLPIGSEKITESVMKNLRTTRETAISLLKIYENGKAEASIKEKIDQLIVEFRSSWSKYLAETLTHLAGGVSLPSNCYILGQMPLWSFFSELVRAEDYTQFSFSEGKFNVQLISSLSFLSLVDFNKELPDLSVAIGALFAERICIRPSGELI